MPKDDGFYDDPGVLDLFGGSPSPATPTPTTPVGIPTFPPPVGSQVDTTLADVWVHFDQKFDAKGTSCPACGQRVRLTHAKINRGHVLFMSDLHRLSSPAAPWVHRKDCKSTGNRDYNRLKDWGLIEMKPNDKDPTKKDSGFWRLTPIGEAFLHGKLRVPKYIYLYNNTLLGESADTGSVDDAWGSPFDYATFINP